METDPLTFFPEKESIVLKLTDVADHLDIDPRKFTQYVLNPDSLHGQHKARVFESILGFTIKNYTELIRQLKRKAMQADVRIHSEDEFGTRYTADIEIEGIERQQATVRTGWIVPSDARTAYLVTLYVKRR